MSAAILPAVSQTLERLLTRTRLRLEVSDLAGADPRAVTLEDAVAPAGYLPVFVVCAEALWFDLTGSGFDLDLQLDAHSAVGITLRAIRAGSVSAVMLCLIDVVTRAQEPGVLRLDRLIDLWADYEGRVMDVPSVLAGAGP